MADRHPSRSGSGRSALDCNVTRRAEPVRTCVGCRTRAAKSDLLRVVAVGSALVPDPRGTMPGRGAHLHLDRQCLALAERRRVFPRALRLEGPLDPAAVQEYVARHDRSEQSGTT
ncbi:MAG TPA: YlxR family protein [Mycobacteriales bacterium]|nr:YlxR family protein [Mycobacteriales bacterium]